MHDLKNIMENQYNTFSSKLAENKHKNKLFVTGLEEYVSPESFEVINIVKNSNSNMDMLNSHNSMNYQILLQESV